MIWLHSMIWIYSNDYFFNKFFLFLKISGQWMRGGGGGANALHNLSLQKITLDKSNQRLIKSWLQIFFCHNKFCLLFKFWPYFLLRTLSCQIRHVLIISIQSISVRKTNLFILYHIWDLIEKQPFFLYSKLIVKKGFWSYLLIKRLVKSLIHIEAFL